jgi:hypothetical protein
VIIARNNFNHAEWIIISLAYVEVRGYMIMTEHLRDLEENEIVREWDMHQKLDPISESLEDIVRDQYVAKAR